MSNAPLDQSGVWRYREFIPFLDDLVACRHAARRLHAAPARPRWPREYGGLDAVVFKHQGFNPTGSFKDNGMTCGASQAVAPRHDARGLRLHRQHFGIDGRLRQFGGPPARDLHPLRQHFLRQSSPRRSNTARKTIQVEANFDQILALVRTLADRLGIYLLNSINPFRIEGQKTIMVEMLDQRDWQVPDWVVLPGGNLGNISAFGKGLRELKELGLIDRLPRLAVVQAEGSAPFYDLMHAADRSRLHRRGASPRRWLPPSRSATRCPGPRRCARSTSVGRGGEGDRAGDRRCQGGDRALRHRLRAGLGGDPGRNPQADGAGVMRRDADVVAVLTGNVLKDPGYIHEYHTGVLVNPDGNRIRVNFRKSAGSTAEQRGDDR